MTFVLVDYKGGSTFKDCVHLPHVTGMVTDLDVQGRGQAPIPFGLIDLPDLQRQQPAVISLGTFAELTWRQDLLAEGGFASVTEQRAVAPPQDRLPHVVVLLDRWEGFVTSLGETGGGALTDVITQILAEGASAGIHLVMTGDRSLLAGRIAAMCEDKLTFRLAERDDYALAGLRPRDLPQHIGPARAFRAGTGTETQAALLAPTPSDQG